MEKQLSQEMLEVIFQIPTQMRKLNTQAMLGFLMRKIVEVLRVERVSIYKVFDEFEECRLILGEPAGKHGIGQILPFSEFPYHAETVKTKVYLQKKEPGLDPSIKQSKELIYVEEITAWLILPLLIENEVEWLVVVDAKWPRMEFSDEEISFCMSLGNHGGLLLERDRMQRLKDEKEAMAEIGEVAAEAVHRLRNPIMYTCGFARRLKNLIGNEITCQTCKGKEYAEIILNGNLVLEKTLDDLLRFARPKKAEISHVNINEIIMGVYQSLERLTIGKEIKLGLNLDQELPAIAADPTDIKEVISPILYNAVEAIKGKGEIKIKSRQENDWIRITISNNGGCIDEEILHQVFNPFFTTKQGATGLGLATAMATVRAYDGTIKIENDKERNLTHFTVKLPIGSDLATERR